MDYDGGWQLRICRWLSWMALAGGGFVFGGVAGAQAYIPTSATEARPLRKM